MQTQTEIAIANQTLCDGLTNLIADSYVKAFGASNETVALTKLSKAADLPATAGPECVTLGLSGADLSLTLHLLFATDFAIEMANHLKMELTPEKSRRMAVDLIKEVCNVTSGFVARRLLPDISLVASVPSAKLISEIKLDLSNDKSVHTFFWCSANAPVRFACVAELRVVQSAKLFQIDWKNVLEQEPEGIELL